jgi:hypothetical protein
VTKATGLRQQAKTKANFITKKFALGLLAIVFAISGADARAQQTIKIPRIEYLAATMAAAIAARTDAFRQGLQKLGYVEGKSIAVDYRYAQSAAGLKIKLQMLDVRTPADIEVAFRAAVKERADGALFLGSVLFGAHRRQIAELAVKHRLPATYSRLEFVEDGGLMTYGPNINDLFRRAATYVGKILTSAKPADLPVQQPIKFEFIVNLTAAKQIGVTIPQFVLYRTDKVIK